MDDGSERSAHGRAMTRKERLLALPMPRLRLRAGESELRASPGQYVA
jgi:hypothetical protein